MSSGSEHRTVLLDEAVEQLVTDASGYYIDGTFGRGGHSRMILSRLNDDGLLLAIDRDPEAVRHGEKAFADDPRIELVHAEFSQLRALAAARGREGKVSGVLLDLGVSSPQLDQPARGFSFLRDGPLDMRMNPAHGPSAADWIAAAGAEEIARVLREFGEERFATRIARGIVASRERTPITTTRQLATAIAEAMPVPDPHKHPATRSFQAIRIYINRELDELRAALDDCIDLLAPGGRLVVISFHSLEDRIVKRFMRDRSTPARAPRGIPVPESDRQAPMRLVCKAQRPGRAEVAANPRARSAVLRVAERVTG